MITFKRILFPVDFSAHNRAVLPAVKAMAQRFGAEVVVLHVVDLPTSWLGSPEAAAWAALLNADRLRASGQVALERFAEEEFAGARVRLELAEGDAARQIIDYAQEGKLDLIMLPTHGYGPFRALLLGSVTAKVLHDTRCPVWTGVHAQESSAHPPERWRRMLCAVDTNGHDLRVLRWAAEFAAGQGVDLRLVHAVPGTNTTVTESQAPETYKFLFDAARESLARLQAEAGTRFEVCLLGGPAGQVVRTAAMGHDSDLVVIGRGVIQESFGRLRSRAYSIIRQAPCPVISI